MTCGLFLNLPPIACSSAERYLCQAHVEFHPLPQRVTLLPCFTVNLLNFLLYSPLYTSLYIPNFTSLIMEPTVSQVRNHYSQLVLATVPFSDCFYYSSSMKTRTWPVRSGFVQNGSLNQVHKYSSDNLVFGTWNMQLLTAHLLVVSDFWYL